MKYDGIEVWMVEVPGKVLKCFGLNKTDALAFAQQMGKDATMWDMMSDDHKGNYGGQPQEKA